MGIFLLIFTIILFLISINKTNRKIYDKNFRKFKTELIQARRKILILGLVSIILILVFTIVLSINENTGNDQILPVVYILLLLYIISMFSFIVQWILIPSKEKIKGDVKKEKIAEELNKYKFEKKLKYNSNSIWFDYENRILVILNTYKNTYDIVKFDDIVSCDILEDNKSIMSEDNGAIIAIGTKKNRGTIELKIKINTRENSYTVCIRDTEIENSALDFVNKVYKNIMEIKY